MRGLKAVTLAGLILCPLLFVVAASGLRPVPGRARAETVAALRRSRWLAAGGLLTFVIAATGSIMISQRAKREFREEARRNMEALVEGTREAIEAKKRHDG